MSLFARGRRRLLIGPTCAAVPVLVAMGCGSSSDSPKAAPSEGEDASAGSETSTTPPPDDPEDAGVDVDASLPVFTGTCADPVPNGAQTPPPLPTYSGTCPALELAPAKTTIKTSGADRLFAVVRPDEIAQGEKLPLVFMWHWLGGSADSMAKALELQAAANLKRMIFVLPEAKDDLTFKWPMMPARSAARHMEELQYFDDMLACVAAALPINESCVASGGVSAGALYTDQLVMARSERLSSFISLSGGVGAPAKPWATPPRAVPGIVLWGGPIDRFPNPQAYIADFEVMSKSLVDGLTKDGNFFLECIHNCGHVAPPVNAPPEGQVRYDFIFQFVLDHPYWTTPGASPYVKAGLAATVPAWCGLGKGSATMRTDACP